VIRPPALRPGARVALVAPAGPVVDEGIDRAAQRIRDWGWEPVVGAHARGSHLGYLSAGDEARAADFNAALRDPSIDALWSLRGGYGVMRILPAIDWNALAARPRPVIGYSDNTAIHSVMARMGIVSFHAPHPATVEFNDFSREVFLRVLEEGAPAGLLPFPADHAGRAETLAPGVAEAPLVGGNLSLVAATLGTPYAIDARGSILFLEEVGESAYKLDRLLTQLLLAGVFDGAAGVAVGRFTEVPEPTRPGTPTPEQLVHERLGSLGIPVAMGFPFGHVDDNWTLPVGVRARLDAGAGTLELLEAAVG